ncbi:MAG: HAMP domain-containing histidine kinase [Phycisphaerae bacterium]|nr:HAMP domain-containing histidine kinase [Phycisphaerae bacterium]
MSMLINGLLSISRVGQNNYDIITLDINNTISDVIATIQYQVKQYRVDIKVDTLPECLANSNMLNQVFDNLFSNAIKYRHAKRKPTIHVSGKIIGDKVEYRIIDNGIGIKPEFTQKVFNIFYQLEPGKHTQSYGLGLAIVKRIIEELNGNIKLESEYGIGSTFIITLPSGNSPT